MMVLEQPWVWWIAGIGLALIGLLAGLMMARRLPTIMSPDGRRAWAFAAIVGGCVVFTVFAAVGVWELRDEPLYTLILALAAHAQILVGMTALGWLLGRKMQFEGTRDGVRLSDQDAPMTKVETTVTTQVPPLGGEE